MKKIGISVGLIISVFVLAVFLFELTPLTSAITQTPAAPPPGSTFEQRLEQRKKEQNEQLDEKRITHLQKQCLNSQTVLRQGQAKTISMLDKRNNTYRNIDAILWVNIGELKLADQATFNLEEQRAALSAKMAEFKTVGEYYRQARDDLLVINCPADAVGFMALIDTARAYYAQLSAKSQEIHSYIVNTIKPTLDSFNAPLEQRSNNNSGS